MESQLLVERFRLAALGDVQRESVETSQAGRALPTLEMAPALLVPTVKSPLGRLRARICICGNHLTKVHEEGKIPSAFAIFALYAGGADGTMLRALMRRSAAAWYLRPQ